MPISSFPVAVPRRIVVTLTSGTSWTVPNGVTNINATLFGGGSGASGSRAGLNTTDYGQAGKPGAGGQVITSNVSTTPGASISYAIGAGGTAGSGTGEGGAGGNTTFTGATTATGGTYVGSTGQGAANGGIGNLGPATSGNAGGSGKIEIEYWV
jgi:hypothetical protein